MTAYAVASAMAEGLRNCEPIAFSRNCPRKVIDFFSKLGYAISDNNAGAFIWWNAQAYRKSQDVLSHLEQGSVLVLHGQRTRVIESVLGSEYRLHNTASGGLSFYVKR